MKLIEDLGMQYATKSSKNKYHFGLYECPKCQEYFKCTMYSVKSGNTTKCRKCSDTQIAENRITIARESFFLLALKNHGDTYEYTNTDYTGRKQKVTITCKTHGEFLQMAEDHMLGKGCPKCANLNNANNQRHTKEIFIEKACSMHGDTYTYEYVEYVSSQDKIEITCKVHGNFWQMPTDHIRGHGCKKCSTTGFSTEKPAVLYYLKLVNGTYKIGITNNTVYERFPKRDHDKFSVLKLFYYASGEECLEVEQTYHKAFKEYRSEICILSSGRTEIYKVDVLCLDS